MARCGEAGPAKTGDYRQSGSAMAALHRADRETTSLAARSVNGTRRPTTRGNSSTTADPWNVRPHTGKDIVIFTLR